MDAAGNTRWKAAALAIAAVVAILVAAAATTVVIAQKEPPKPTHPESEPPKARARELPRLRDTATPEPRK